MYGLNQSLLGLGSSVGNALGLSAYSQQMLLSYQQQMLHQRIKQQESELAQMGINPFGPVTGGTWYGKRIVTYEPRTRCYILEDGSKVDRDTIDDVRSNLTGLREVKEPDKLKVTKDYLVQRRQVRWNRHMVRLTQKKWEKRLTVLADWGWRFGSVWLAAFAVILSVYVIKWVGHVVLG